MRYRTFGRLGWKVSELSFGAWAIGGDAWGRTDDSESLRTLEEALDLGVNFIDTAQAYGDGHSEELIGRTLAARGSGAERVYVATKIPPADKKLWWVDPDYDDIQRFYPSAYLRERVELSLRRLKVETLDLIQLHTWTSGFNKYTEWQETLEDLRRQGKLLAYGISASEQRPADVTPLVEAGRIDSVQVIYNLFEQGTGRTVLAPCGRNGVATIVRVPLDEGSLTGKFTAQTTFPKGDFRRHYFRGDNLKVTLEHVERVRQFKAERYPELSMVDLALLYTLSHPDAGTVIVGLKNREQLRQNLKVTGMELFKPTALAELAQFEWNRDPWSQDLKA